MKLWNALCCLLSLSCCKAQRTEVSAILAQPESLEYRDSISDRIRYHFRMVPITEVLSPGFIIQNQDPRKFQFIVQGKVASGGRQIRRFKKFRIEKKQVADTLYVQYYACIVAIPGKEGNQILGYNYKKVETLPLAKDLLYLSLELLEESPPSISGSGPKIKSLARELITIKPD